MLDNIDCFCLAHGRSSMAMVKILEGFWSSAVLKTVIMMNC